METAVYALQIAKFVRMPLHALNAITLSIYLNNHHAWPVGSSAQHAMKVVPAVAAYLAFIF